MRLAPELAPYLVYGARCQRFTARWSMFNLVTVFARPSPSLLAQPSASCSRLAYPPSSVPCIQDGSTWCRHAPPGGCCMFSFWVALRVWQRISMLPDMRQSHQHGPFIVCFYCFYSWIFLIVLAVARPGSVSWVSIFPMCSALWRAISPLVGRYRRQIPHCAPLGLSTRENSSLP